MVFDSVVKLAATCLLCFCFVLKQSQSEEANGYLISNNSSQERVRPTPLIFHLNQSTAQLLIQEANSVFVSNTSLSDLYNDNATQQMLLRYRERKRQVRILNIQREILQKLGLTHGPNVTARLSAEERQSLVRSFDRTMMVQTEGGEDNDTACIDPENDIC